MRNIFLLLILILLFNQSLFLQEARDFLIEFVKTTRKGKVLGKLSEQCLGKFFDYRFLLAKKNYKENDFRNLSKNVENIAIDTFLNCPVEELIAIFEEEDFIDVFSQDFDFNFYLKALSIGKILLFDIYNSNNVTGTSLGKTFGKILNLFKVNFTEPKEIDSENKTLNNSTFLDNIKEEDYFEFISGLFNGMKEKEGGNESECYKDIVKGKDKIMKQINDGKKKLEEGKGIGETITSVLFNLVTVEGLVVDCNLLSLGSSIISKVTSMNEMTELFSKIMENSGIYIIYGGLIYDSFINKNLKDAGKYIGKIISKVFDFYVK